MFLLVAVVASSNAYAQGDTVARSDTASANDTSKLTIKPSISAMVATFRYNGAWFGLAGIGAPQEKFDESRGWTETWMKPKVIGTYKANHNTDLYAGLSLMASKTFGGDAFDVRNEGGITLEDAFVGVRFGRKDELQIDLSGGQQNYGIGSGMMIWQGASNGFAHGALNVQPRRAWGVTALAKVHSKAFSLEGFLLEPNELKTNRTETRIVGLNANYQIKRKTLVGAAFLAVPHSRQAYPLPTLPLIIENGRDGLKTLHGYAELNGELINHPDIWAKTEFAIQRNGRIDQRSHAYSLELGYQFLEHRMMPSIAYRYAVFSGDNPNTSNKYERFDPLYYGNGTDGWYFGANSSYVFLNSNLRFQRITSDWKLSKADFLRVQFINVRADKLRSPIQFGQFARLDIESGGIVVGVTSPQLSNELYVSWSRTLTKKMNFTLWGSTARPGKGLKTASDAVKLHSWTGFSAVVSVHY